MLHFWGAGNTSVFWYLDSPGVSVQGLRMALSVVGQGSRLKLRSGKTARQELAGYE